MNMLKAKIVEFGETQADLANLLGIALSNLSLRITGKVDFRSSEIRAIKEHYHLSPEDVCAIFFN